MFEIIKRNTVSISNAIFRRHFLENEVVAIGTNFHGESRISCTKQQSIDVRLGENDLPTVRAAAQTVISVVQ